MKVYLVSEGSYSDYRIIRAFSTKEKAEKFIEFYKNFGYEINKYIEEFEIDDFKSNKMVKKKLVHMSMDGNDAFVYETIYLFEKLNNEYLRYINNNYHYDGLKTYYNLTEDIYKKIQEIEENIFCFVDAKYNEKKAIKVANEKRVQFLLNNNR